MNRQILTFAGVVLAIVSLSIVAFGWSSWEGTQRSAKRGGARQVAPQQPDGAASSNQPDTRRDAFISAHRAPSAAEIGSGTWLNSEPLNLEALRGKVVLVDFWTFGCYNCRNTLPTLKRLNAKYSDKGLTIVGVHAPESDHEKNVGNVRSEVQKLGIKYPVVTDNDYQTWRAYNVQAWPTVVILDKQGRIRFTHIGEGMYEQQEQIIQKLLAEESATEQASDVVPDVDSTRKEEAKMNEKVVKTEAEWRAELTPQQFNVMREKGTERAFTGEYNDSKKEGVYKCAACGQELFNSAAKFDSGTGWPSFYQPSVARNVTEHSDRAYGMTRTEVLCSRCDSHLGHVFTDGPRPTGLRYCMNSVALKLDETR